MDPLGCGVLHWAHDFCCGVLYMTISLGVLSMSIISCFNLASMRHWIRFWEAFVKLFLLLPINTPWTFHNFACAVALSLGDGASIVSGVGIGLCNTLVLLCLVRYCHTLWGVGLLNNGSLPP